MCIRDRICIIQHGSDNIPSVSGLDVPALNIVMITTICNGMDAAKISDTPVKGMCKNPDYVDYLNRCIDYRMKNDR